MIKFINKRRKSDCGDGMAVFGVFLVLVILFIATVVGDLTKKTNIKNTYENYAQIAANTAIKQLNTAGGLKSTAINTAIDEYMKQRSPYKYSIAATNETAAFRKGCDTGQYPIIEISFDTSRKIGTTISAGPYKSVNGNQITLTNAINNTFKTKELTVINLKITDVSLGDFSGIWGDACQIYKIEVSAIVTDSYTTK